jgi:tRNA-uridine 2-sulfurtransferase
MPTNPYTKGQQSVSTGHLPGTGKKVVVAMSGGVDSSVAALLLKQQGYEVVGIALQVTDYSKFRDDKTSGTCCSIKDMEDARRVADAIQMPFYVLDTESAFDAHVVDYFINDYLQGRTPNPCVMCNSKVKFNHLYKKAMDMGADFIATGHYAKLSTEAKMGATLWKARDEAKDQTYFLFNLTQRQLEKTIFPLGHLTKPEVRELAEKFHLPVAQKPDSQEICFVPGNDYSKFINGRIANSQRKGGYIVDQFNNVLSNHEGIYHYTIGQRKGIGQALDTARKIGHPDADNLCVTKIDPMKHLVVLGSERELNQWGLIATNVNFIVPPDLRHNRRLQVKIRYKAEAADCVVRMLGDNRVEVRFMAHQRAITPGQACVFYDGNMCLGGGWISEAIKVREEDRPKVGAGGVEMLSV